MEPTGRDNGRGLDGSESPVKSNATAESPVLEEEMVCESSHEVEAQSATEERLVARGDSREPAERVGTAIDETMRQTTGIEATTRLVAK